MTKKTTKIKASLFFDLVARFPVTAWSMRDQIIQYAKSDGANGYRQTQAFLILNELVGQVPALVSLRRSPLVLSSPFLRAPLPNSFPSSLLLSSLLSLSPKPVSTPPSDPSSPSAAKPSTPSSPPLPTLPPTPKLSKPIVFETSPNSPSSSLVPPLPSSDRITSLQRGPSKISPPSLPSSRPSNDSRDPELFTLSLLNSSRSRRELLLPTRRGRSSSRTRRRRLLSFLRSSLLRRRSR